jgi:hypothetical protein
MDKVYSASTGHISGAAYTISDAAYSEKMEELVDKVHSASTGHISGASYLENGGTNS